MRLEAVTDNVFRCLETPLRLDPSVIPVLLDAAERSPLRRARICMHADDEAHVQEMLIVLLRDVYIRPHKHPGRPESFHVIEGSVGVTFYEDDGAVRDRMRLTAGSRMLPFYYRMDTAIFHAHVILSEYALFHECTSGPFRRDATVMASWAPGDQTPEAAAFVAASAAAFGG
jgi:cupin fold WbuC family metalloprotein